MAETQAYKSFTRNALTRLKGSLVKRFRRNESRPPEESRIYICNRGIDRSPSYLVESARSASIQSQTIDREEKSRTPQQTSRSLTIADETFMNGSTDQDAPLGSPSSTSPSRDQVVRYILSRLMLQLDMAKDDAMNNCTLGKATAGIVSESLTSLDTDPAPSRTDYVRQSIQSRGQTESLSLNQRLLDMPLNDLKHVLAGLIDYFDCERKLQPASASTTKDTANSTTAAANPMNTTTSYSTPDLKIFDEYRSVAPKLASTSVDALVSRQADKRTRRFEHVDDVSTNPSTQTANDVPDEIVDHNFAANLQGGSSYTLQQRLSIFLEEVAKALSRFDIVKQSNSSSSSKSHVLYEQWPSQWQAEAANEQFMEAVRDTTGHFHIPAIDDDDLTRDMLQQRKAERELGQREPTPTGEQHGQAERMSQVEETAKEAHQVDCAVCGEEYKVEDVYRFQCLHTYCRTCLTQTIEHAIKNRVAFKCCQNGLDSSTATSFLLPCISKRYTTLLQEIENPNPIYCSKRFCSTFIPPANIKAGTATCPRCSAQTCSSCKKRSHSGICKKDEDGQALMKLGDARRWKKCPYCGNLVERVDGCAQITCLCGHRFCYSCGKPMKKCSRFCRRW